MDVWAKDLLSKIFVIDPNLRISLDDIKNHKFFRVSYPNILYLCLDNKLEAS